MDHSGDGWAIQANGARFWGVEGAAGLLLRAPGPDGLPMVLMQYRAEWTSMPLTWGVPGGARDADETVEEAALREAIEEAGLNPQDVTVVQK
ncbi:MAG: NUDIX domain-containing protein, partial [Corynebacterium kroppenstedtii]|nr:NUDIX domain-containing protein [Corynebacterium kroppenstedtii]